MKKLALNMKNQEFDDNTIAKCLNIGINTLNKLLQN